MIQKDKVMKLLVEVCPSFEKKWKDHVEDIWDRESETILYTDFSEFARHLYELAVNKDFKEFLSVFDIIELLLQEGDSFVKEAVAIGFLEDFQTLVLGGGYDSNIIEHYLREETKKCWIKLDKFWKGEIPYIDNE
jgi:hypothetical protein